MQLWYDPLTMELKAVYFDRYSGSVWGAAGYLPITYDIIQSFPREFHPGAIIDISGAEPVVVTHAPPPLVSPNRARILELRGELARDPVPPFSDTKLLELLRLQLKE